MKRTISLLDASMKVLVTLALFMIPFHLFAAVVTATGSGNWASVVPNAPWPGGTPPSVGDDVIIASGFNVTVTANTVCNSISVKSGGGTLTITGAAVTFTTAALTLENLGGGTGSTVTGTGQFVLNGGLSLNYTGAGAITSGSSITCPVLANGIQNFTIADDGSSNNDLTVSGVISGTGGYSKAGAGTLFISGTNTFTGGAGLSAGILVLGNNAALGNLAATVTISGGTIDVNAARTCGNNPHIWNGNFTFTGNNTLNFGTGAKTLNTTITVTAQASTFTVGGVISGTGGIVKNGAGNLTLSGANTYSGNVVLNAGILDLSNNLALGASTNTLIINGGSLDVGAAISVGTNPQIWNSDFTFIGANTLNLGTGSVTLSSNVIITTNASSLTVGGVISGGFSLTKSGAGTLTLSGANTFTGGFTLNTGILNINNASALGSVVGTFTINGGTINNSTAATITTVNYPLTITADFTFSGTRQLQLGTSGFVLPADLTITCNGTTLPLVIVGVISGANALIKAGPGSLTLSGSNTFSGGFSLNAGTVNINNANALGNAANTFTIKNGTTVANTSGVAVVMANYPIALDGDFLTTASSNASTLDLGTGTLTLTANRTITNSTPGRILIINRVIDGAFKLTKSGAGTLTLSNTNTFTGGFEITAGVLNINNSTALGAISGAVTITGGTLANTTGALMTLINYNFTINGNFTSSSTAANPLNFGNGTVTLNADRTFTVTTHTLTIDAVISGAFRLTKAGNGTLVLNNANTYSGTTLNAGILEANHINALGTSGNSFIIGGAGTLRQATGGTQVLSNHSLVLNANLTVNIASPNDLTIDNTISGTGRLTKSGTAALTLLTANTHGGTTVSAGTLNINHAQALGGNSNAFIVSASATIDNTSGAGITLNNYPVSLNNTLAFTGTNNLSFGTGTITLNNNRTINVIGGELTINGDVTGAFRLTKGGAGALNITAATSQSGFTLTTGTLNIGHAQALGDGSSSVILTAGTIDNTSGGNLTLSNNNPFTLAGNIAFTGTNNLNIGNGIVTLSGNRTLTVDGGILVIAGILAESGGARSLTKDGGGMLTLSGVNTHSGGTTLNSGVLNFNNAAAAGSGGIIINGGTIDNTTMGAITLNDNPQTWNGNFNYGGSGDLNVGTGVITLTSDIQITNSSTGILDIGGIINHSNLSLIYTGTGTLRFYNAQDITVQDFTISGGTVVSTAGNLNVTRNFSNDATFTHNSGRVIFNGGAAQAIGGTTSTTFHQLELNNINGLSINKAAFIANELVLTDGIITATALITLNSGGIANEGSATAFVDGTLRKIGNQDFVFPLGDGTIWAPIAVSNFSTGDVTTQFDAQYNDAQPASINFTDMTSPLKRVSYLEYWELSHSGGTAPTVNVTLHWKDHSRSGTTINGSATSSDLVVAHWNGTKWESAGQSAVSIGAAGFVTSNAVSSFSPFTPGATGGAFGDIPLPVELLNFQVKKLNKINELTWATASEINNDYFEIQRSEDGINFSAIGTVKGKENATQVNQYSFCDKHPNERANYYRLRQVDKNGDFAFSEIILIENYKLSNFQVYPNPMISGEKLNLSSTYAADLLTSYEISLTDLKGRLIYSSSLGAEYFQNGSYTLPVELSTGVYRMKLISDTGIFVFRIVVR